MATAFASQLLARIKLQTVMERWPAVCQELVDRGMACVGCPMAAFETVEVVERVYGLRKTAMAGILLRHCPRRGRRAREPAAGTASAKPDHGGPKPQPNRA